MRPIRKNSFIDKAFDAAKEMSTEHFAKQKLMSIADKGIKIDWRKPERDVIQELTAGLILTGTNKYMADRAAKQIYINVASAMKGGKASAFRNKHLMLVPAADVKRGGLEAEKRIREGKFERKKNKIADKVIVELRNFDYDARKTEEAYINAVKLTWAYRAALGGMSSGEAERMAVELARVARRKRQTEAGFLRRIQR